MSASISAEFSTITVTDLQINRVGDNHVFVAVTVHVHDRDENVEYDARSMHHIRRTAGSVTLRAGDQRHSLTSESVLCRYQIKSGWTGNRWRLSPGWEYHHGQRDQILYDDWIAAELAVALALQERLQDMHEAGQPIRDHVDRLARMWSGLHRQCQRRAATHAATRQTVTNPHVEVAATPAIPTPAADNITPVEITAVEVAIRGIDLTATSPIFSPMLAAADATLSAAGLNAAQAEEALVIRSIRGPDPIGGVHHVHLVRSDGGAWRVATLEHSTEGPDLDYLGATVIVNGIEDGHLRIRPVAPANAKVRPQVQVLAFDPRPDDSATVTASIQYQGGSGDILRGRHWRDGGARTWDHIHRCHSSAEFQRAAQSAATQDVAGDFWEDLHGDELLGPGSAGLQRWVWPADGDFVYFSVLPAADEEGIRPETARFYATQDADAIIAAADRAVSDHWQHHPSPCRLRELEVDVRDEAAVRASPILRPLAEAADDAIERFGLTHAQANGATVTITIFRHDDCEAGEGYHVTLRRDPEGTWHVYDVVSDGGAAWVDTGDDYLRPGHSGDHVSIPRSSGRHARLDIVRPDEAWPMAA